MLNRYRRYRCKQQSLQRQIEQVERQLLNHQQNISIHSATLIDKTLQQLSNPVNLLLASGVGFIIGELTKNQTNYRGTAAGSPLKNALRLATSIQHLYAALPLIWLIKSFRQPYPSSRLASPNR